jgi:hypothetical protein
MTYAKNSTWTSGTAITTAKLNNLETQFGDAYTDFLAHAHDDRYNTRAVMETTFWYAGNTRPNQETVSDADLLWTATGAVHKESLVGMGVPSGLIIMWSMAVGSVPDGWHKCDGTDGYIDLRDKFVPGAGGSLYTVGSTGGANVNAITASSIVIGSHVLVEAEMPSHRHLYSDYHPDPASVSTALYYGPPYPIALATTMTTVDRWTSAQGGNQGHTHTGYLYGDNNNWMPAYYALCFIQKI